MWQKIFANSQNPLSTKHLVKNTSKNSVFLQILPRIRPWFYSNLCAHLAFRREQIKLHQCFKWLLKYKTVCFWFWEIFFAFFSKLHLNKTTRLQRQACGNTARLFWQPYFIGYVWIFAFRYCIQKYFTHIFSFSCGISASL